MSIILETPYVLQTKKKIIMVQVNVTFTIFKQHLTQEKTVPYQML